MGYEWDNDCVGCDYCINCGRREDFKVYFCDKCEECTDELYVGNNGEELCEDCYKEQFNSKICDDCDVTKCSSCGYEAEIMYQIEGNEWFCEKCLMDMAEKVERGD